MSSWKVVGSVIAGTVATAVMTIVTIILLPIVGFVATQLVGDWLSIWMFLVPIAICATLGGVITGYLQGTTSRKSAILGGVAAACGLSAIGAVVGLIFLGFMLGMAPAHGQETDLSRAALIMFVLGGGVGLISGGVFGAIGGAGGHAYRQ